MHTVLEIIKKTTDFLAGKGIENPRLNAEHLVGHALALPRMQLYLQFERPLLENELELIRAFVRRRGQREPLQYIVGETDFFGVTLKIDRRALIPRPETEQLLSLVVAKTTAAPESILDLGTGSGAIALGLAAHYPNALVTGVDVSEEAVSLARENAVALALTDRVSILPSDWFSKVPKDSKFDLIVANPPYLSAAETAETLAEVRDFEPRVALTPGQSGMEAIQRILQVSHDYQDTGGLLAMETGINQHAELARLFVKTGYAKHEFASDLAGRPRYAFAWAD